MSETGQQQLRVIEELWQQLRSIEPARDRRARRRTARLRTVRTLALAAVLMLALVGAALAARSLLTGEPAPRSFPAPLGRVTPGSLRLLDLRVADPDGGPPWGMRLFATNRRGGCFQVGRVVDGKLVALGRDGAFHDDGLAHELPLESHGCGGVDAVGHLRFGAIAPVRNASAYVGDQRCLAPDELSLLERTPAEARAALARDIAARDAAAARSDRRALRRAERRLAAGPTVCPTAELRTILAGATSPAAESVSLRGRGIAVDESVTASDGGAYLFVLAGKPDLRALQTTVRYRTGLTCPLPNLTSPTTAQPPSPACARPPGIVPRTRARHR